MPKTSLKGNSDTSIFQGLGKYFRKTSVVIQIFRALNF